MKTVAWIHPSYLIDPPRPLGHEATHVQVSDSQVALVLRSEAETIIQNLEAQIAIIKAQMERAGSNAAAAAFNKVSSFAASKHCTCSQFGVCEAHQVIAFCEEETSKARDGKSAKSVAGGPAQSSTWVGCGECDCSFDCHDGRVPCVRIEQGSNHGNGPSAWFIGRGIGLVRTRHQMNYWRKNGFPVENEYFSRPAASTKATSVDADGVNHD